MVIRCESGGGPGYLLVQEWTVLLLSLALAAVQKFMVTELQWLTLLNSTWLYILYHGSTPIYFTLHYSTMAPLQSTSLYITLHYLLYSSLYLTLYYSTMDLLHSTSLYLTLPWLYITLTWLYSRAWLYIFLPWLYFTLLDSTLLYHSSTSIYVTPNYFSMALLHSTWLYITLPWLYFTPLDSTLFNMGLLLSTLFYINLT